MLTIRLSRIGKKGTAMYRLIISEKARDTYGRSLEILGSYNPFTKKLRAKEERIQYWLNHGSGMSPTINNLLIEKGIIKGEKIKASKMSKKKKDEKEIQENKKTKKPPSVKATADKQESKVDAKQNKDTKIEEEKESKEDVESKEKLDKPANENKAESADDKNKEKK